MSLYTAIITEATGLTGKEADEVEDYMRHIIFHSTLDWQSREQLKRAAKEAVEDLKHA